MSLLGLLIFVIMILLINPRIFMNLYTTVLGRIVLLIFVILLAMHSLTFGLLAALIVIISAQLAFREGLESGPTPSATPVVTGVPASTPPAKITSSTGVSDATAAPVGVPMTATLPAAPTVSGAGTTSASINSLMSSIGVAPATPAATIPPVTPPQAFTTKTDQNKIDRITMSELLRPKVGGEYVHAAEQTEPVASNGHGFKSSYSLF